MKTDVTIMKIPTHNQTLFTSKTKWWSQFLVFISFHCYFCNESCHKKIARTIISLTDIVQKLSKNSSMLICKHFYAAFVCFIHNLFHINLFILSLEVLLLFCDIRGNLAFANTSIHQSIFRQCAILIINLTGTGKEMLCLQ